MAQSHKTKRKIKKNIYTLRIVYFIAEMCEIFMCKFILIEKTFSKKNPFEQSDICLSTLNTICRKHKYSQHPNEVKPDQ